jgi:hypothetical protein
MSWLVQLPCAVLDGMAAAAALREIAMRKMTRLTEELLRQPWQKLDVRALRARASWNQPGVYALAYTGRVPGKRPIDDPRSVFYVGMSRARKGVKGRLEQFLNGIEKDGYHSGAMRFFREYAGSVPFSQLQGRKRFFVAALTVPCEVRPDWRTAEDLRCIGHVACLEYYVRAFIKEATGREPALNKQ